MCLQGLWHYLLGVALSPKHSFTEHLATSPALGDFPWGISLQLLLLDPVQIGYQSSFSVSTTHCSYSRLWYPALVFCLCFRSEDKYTFVNSFPKSWTLAWKFMSSLVKENLLCAVYLSQELYTAFYLSVGFSHQSKDQGNSPKTKNVPLARFSSHTTPRWKHCFPWPESPRNLPYVYSAHLSPFISLHTIEWHYCPEGLSETPSVRQS